MLVSIKGKEEVVLPSTLVDGLDGSCMVNSLGTMELTGNLFHKKVIVNRFTLRKNNLTCS